MGVMLVTIWLLLDQWLFCSHMLILGHSNHHCLRKLPI